MRLLLAFVKYEGSEDEKSKYGSKKRMNDGPGNINKQNSWFGKEAKEVDRITS